ncbi:MFS transporter [Microbacterium pseudoresistens]|uniref:Putative MFS family arabinose efflux permease n=1 Tax=Microbacterium pseudoresistens TaxID=640634 RepID=A0A7Y9EU94_9MICO|nr:MFS transporter [Microbacterium pseudoresistens]NYD53914.1 putative MFS family arabinose efflux permease [Microbacterium pseudoresistens]
MTALTTPASLWTNLRYLLWLVSDTAKGLGSALFGFAIPLIALFVTDDPAQAGVIGGIGMAVRVATTLIGGVLADRHRRILLMLLGAGIAAVLSLGFTMLALGDALTFTVLLVVEVLLMLRAGLFEPASESALKELVPDAAMGRAQAANQGRDAVLQLAGGPLGGALLAVGAWLVGVAMTVCFGVAAFMAWLLRRTPADPALEAAVSNGPVPARDRNPARGVLREIGEGFGWLFSRPDLRGVLFVATIINLGFNAALTTVIYALQQQGHSALTIGLLSTAAGAAMLVGALVAPMLVAKVPAGVVVIGALGIAVVGMLGLVPVHGPLALAGVLAVCVFFIPAVNAALGGYFMVATPSALLGRANSANQVLGMGAMPLAPLIAGFGLAWAGREATLLAAITLSAVSVVLAASNRALRELPAEAGWAAHAARFAITAETPGR